MKEEFDSHGLIDNKYHMLDFIVQNAEWIFSGVGATALTFITALIARKKKRQQEQEKANSTQSVQNSSLNNSNLNNFVAESINYHQNVYNSGGSNELKNNETTTITSEDLLHTKEDFYKAKKRLRTFIYRILIPARNTKNVIAVKDITDAVEDKLELAPNVVVNELKEMEEEELIEFHFGNDPKIITPYTRISLKPRFYASIKADH